MSLLVIEMHPIQVPAPVYSALQQTHGIPVTVAYGPDFSVTGYHDREFGSAFAWDGDFLSDTARCSSRGRTPEANIYSFEPSRTAYQRLLENLKAKDCKNVLVFNCAVASEAGFVDFYEPAGHLSNGSLDRSFAALFAADVARTKVASVSGAEIARLCSNSTSLLLKIDVEGAEPIVVRALESLISSKQPEIVIEVGLAEASTDLNGIECLHSYRLFQLTPDGPLERKSFVSDLQRGRDYGLVPMPKSVSTLRITVEPHRNVVVATSRASGATSAAHA